MSDEPDVRAVERALREHAGLSRRQARALIGGGWRAVVDEAAAERDELALQLAELREALGDGRLGASTPPTP